MRVLYVGETWQGSNARSFKEGLSAARDLEIQELSEDHYMPRHTTTLLRVARRLLRRAYVNEFRGALLQSISQFSPDVLIVYKGSLVSAPLLEAVRAAGIPAVNIFPDFSPHAYGLELQAAVGAYDLVISAKHFHPSNWRSLYGYSNRCVWVPHGYDPQVHLWSTPAPADVAAVALCANWRPEYHELMLDLARNCRSDVRVVIGGNGWASRQACFPRQWIISGPLSGRAYGRFLRAAKIVIAPLNTDVVVRGQRQPGDEDTARTYELAAAYCFFLHRRSELMSNIYDERSEVPMWNDAGELAQLIERWLPDEPGRRRCADNAHARAVPAYSFQERAKLAMGYIQGLVKGGSRA
jgi:spore maturation protein CgeB